MDNYASDSLEYNGPRFSEDVVVAIMYLAVNCIANSRPITVLPSDARDGAAMHVSRCLIDTYNLAHSDGHTLRDGPTVGAEAASTREKTTTKVSSTSSQRTNIHLKAPLLKDLNLIEVKIVDREAARANNGSVEQRPEAEEQKTLNTTGKDERDPQANTRGAKRVAARTAERER